MVSQQTVHEFNRSHPLLENLQGLIAEAEKLKRELPNGFEGVGIKNLLDFAPSTNSKEYLWSYYLSEIKIASDLLKISALTGITNVIISQNNMYDKYSDTLAINSEGAVAASFWANCLPNEKVRKDLFISTLETGSIDIATNPKEIVNVLFFIHVISTGINGAMADLHITKDFHDWLKRINNDTYPGKYMLDIYSIQLEYVKKIYEN